MTVWHFGSKWLPLEGRSNCLVCLLFFDPKFYLHCTLSYAFISDAQNIFFPTFDRRHVGPAKYRGTYRNMQFSDPRMAWTFSHLPAIYSAFPWVDSFPSPQRCRSLQKPWWKQHLVSRWFVFQDLPDDHPSGSLSTLMWVVCLDSVCYNSPLHSPRERLYNATSRTSMNIYEQLVMAQHVAFRIVSSCHHLGEYNNPATIRLVFHDPPWAIFCFH